MARTVFLIRHRLPKGLSAGFRWSLLAIRTNSDPGTDPYVGFESKAVAQEALSNLKAGEEYEVCESGDAGLDTYRHERAQVLMFASASELIRRTKYGETNLGRLENLPSSEGKFVKAVRQLKNWRAKQLSRRWAVES